MLITLIQDGQFKWNANINIQIRASFIGDHFWEANECFENNHFELAYHGDVLSWRVLKNV